MSREREIRTGQNALGEEILKLHARLERLKPASEFWLTLYELLGEYADELGERLDGVEPEGDWKPAYRERLERVVAVRHEVARAVEW